MNRKEKLIPGHFYHIFNRGVEKRRIFGSANDYLRFQRTLLHYLISDKKFTDENPAIEALTRLNLDKALVAGFQQPVELVSYCLMPNHFHLLLKQLSEKGITEYLQQLTTSYTMYFNIKYERVGGLLQGTFKSKRIESEEQLIYASKYIHRNPISPGKTGLDWSRALTYPWSSLKDYARSENQLLLKDPVLCSFKNLKGYLSFVNEVFDEKQILELSGIDKYSNRIFSSN